MCKMVLLRSGFQSSVLTLDRNGDFSASPYGFGRNDNGGRALLNIKNHVCAANMIFFLCCVWYDSLFFGEHDAFEGDSQGAGISVSGLPGIGEEETKGKGPCFRIGIGGNGEEDIVV